MNVIKEYGKVRFVCVQVIDGVASLFDAGRVVAWQVVDDKMERKGMGGLPHKSVRLVGIGTDMTPPDNAVGYWFCDDNSVEFPDNCAFDTFDQAQSYVAENQDYFLADKSV